MPGFGGLLLKNLEASQTYLICFNINIRQDNYLVFFVGPNLAVVYFVKKNKIINSGTSITISRLVVEIQLSCDISQ